MLERTHVECAGPMSQLNAFRNDIPFVKDLGIEFVSADGGRSVLAEMGGSPNGLAFSADRNLYVCNGGGRPTSGSAGPCAQIGLGQSASRDQ